MIFERVKKILMSPKETWKEIAAEKTPVPALFYKYAMYLALIPALSLIIGFGVVGLRVGPGYYRMPINNAIFSAVVSYVLNMAGLFAGGYVVNFIGQYFSAESNINNAMKLVVYSSTAYFVASIFGVIPAIGFLSIVGLYSIYLLYLGVPALMKVPEDKVMSYSIAIIVATLILGFIISSVVTQFAYSPIYSEILTY